MAVKKARNKEWFTIIAPEIFDNKEIGKTMISNPELLPGRRVIMSPVELTENFDKYYMKFIFRVNRIEGNKAFTEFDGSECMRDYVSRMVLRRVSRIDTIQDLTTSDGKKIRVKGLAIISRRAKNSIQIVIRSRIKEILKNEIEKMTLDDLIEDILSDDIKSSVLKEIRSIYPVRNFEIRKTEVILASGKSRQ